MHAGRDARACQRNDVQAAGTTGGLAGCHVIDVEVPAEVHVAKAGNTLARSSRRSCPSPRIEVGTCIVAASSGGSCCVPLAVGSKRATLVRSPRLPARGDGRRRLRRHPVWLLGVDHQARCRRRLLDRAAVYGVLRLGAVRRRGSCPDWPLRGPPRRARARRSRWRAGRCRVRGLRRECRTLASGRGLVVVDRAGQRDGAVRPRIRGHPAVVRASRSQPRRCAARRLPRPSFPRSSSTRRRRSRSVTPRPSPRRRSSAIRRDRPRTA
jgi:hypothetical protein